MFYVFADTKLLRCRYFVAVHSGFKELREGITFIIDTTDDSMLARQGRHSSPVSNPFSFIPISHAIISLPRHMLQYCTEYRPNMTASFFVGNEQKLQKTYQSFPLRPQAL